MPEAAQRGIKNSLTSPPAPLHKWRGERKKNYSPLHLWRGAGGEVEFHRNDSF